MTTGINIELEDLAEKRRQLDDSTSQSADLKSSPGLGGETKDGSVATWAWVSAGLLSLAGSTLLLFPRFLLFLAVSSEFSERALTPLEQFLALHFSFFLFAISVCLVLYIPSDDVFQTQDQIRRRDSLGHPLLGPLTGACLLSSFISYNTRTVGALPFGVFLFTGVIGLWGLWEMLFQGPPHISKKTGADKHTSAFLFGNKTAASVKKKEWKKEQKES